MLAKFLVWLRRELPTAALQVALGASMGLIGGGITAVWVAVKNPAVPRWVLAVVVLGLLLLGLTVSVHLVTKSARVERKQGEIDRRARHEELEYAFTSLVNLRAAISFHLDSLKMKDKDEILHIMFPRFTPLNGPKNLFAYADGADTPLWIESGREIQHMVDQILGDERIPMLARQRLLRTAEPHRRRASHGTTEGDLLYDRLALAEKGCEEAAEMVDFHTDDFRTVRERTNARARLREIRSVWAQTRDTAISSLQIFELS